MILLHFHEVSGVQKSTLVFMIWSYLYFKLLLFTFFPFSRFAGSLCSCICSRLLMGTWTVFLTRCQSHKFLKNVDASSWYEYQWKNGYLSYILYVILTMLSSWKRYFHIKNMWPKVDRKWGCCCSGILDIRQAMSPVMGLLVRRSKMFKDPSAGPPRLARYASFGEKSTAATQDQCSEWRPIISGWLCDPVARWVSQLPAGNVEFPFSAAPGSVEEDPRSCPSFHRTVSAFRYHKEILFVFSFCILIFLTFNYFTLKAVKNFHCWTELHWSSLRCSWFIEDFHLSEDPYNPSAEDPCSWSIRRFSWSISQFSLIHITILIDPSHNSHWSISQFSLIHLTILIDPSHNSHWSSISQFSLIHLTVPIIYLKILVLIFLKILLIYLKVLLNNLKILLIYLKTGHISYVKILALDLYLKIFLISLTIFLIHLTILLIYSKDLIIYLKILLISNLLKIL